MCEVEELMLTFAVICRRQRTPLLATFFGGAALFVGFKFRTMMTQSEAGKKARDKERVNYSVAPGRSGMLPASHAQNSEKGEDRDRR
jgi:hypothetical protein